MAESFQGWERGRDGRARVLSERAREDDAERLGLGERDGWAWRGD